MAIPYNINLLKFIAGCFGVTVHGDDERGLMEAALVELGDALGFSSSETLEFLNHSQGRIVEQFRRHLSAPRDLLSLDELFAELQAVISSWFTMNEARVKELADRFGIFLARRARVSLEEVGPLTGFVFQFWMWRRLGESYDRWIIGEAYASVLVLLAERPEEMNRALSVWRPFPVEFEPQGRHLLQVQGRIAYNATNRLSEHPLDPEDRKGMREYRQNLLDAWILAYETTMFDVCSFLWLAKRRLVEEASLGVMPANKGVVYNEVMAWCTARGFAFPFYENGVKLRNKGAHGSCLLDDRRGMVVFLDRNKAPVGELPQDEVQSAAEHDIAMAGQYFQGVLLARLSYDNLLGSLDEAWRAYKRQVPDVRAVLDLDVCGSSLLGEPAATRDQVIDYLTSLSSMEFQRLMAELQLAWVESE